VEKHWLKSYPPGVRAEINVNEYPSVKELIERGLAVHAVRDAYVQMGKTITFGELDVLSAQFGAFLQSSCGMQKGDRVAIMLPNTLQYPIAVHGALRAGLTVVNTNPLYTTRELEHQLSDSGATVIVILENFAHVLQEVIAHTPIKHVVITSVGEMLGFPKGQIVDWVVRHKRKQVKPYNLPGAKRFKQALKEGAAVRLQPVKLTHEDIAFLQYTGGTTGVAKGAMLTHGNMVANVLQALEWIGPSFPRDPATLITALPMYHIFALTANCLLFVVLGWRNVLITNPRDFPAFVKEMGKYKFTYISGVNTLFNALLHTPGFDKLDFSSLKVTLGGGMAVQESVAKRWKEVTGKILTQAWGLTETSPAACINLPADFLDRDQHPRRRWQRARHQPGGRDLRARSAGDGWLLEASRRNREGDDREGPVADWRYRPHRRARSRFHRGSQEGHDSRVRIQRVSKRGRERRGDPSRRAGSRGDRSGRREVGRGRGAIRGEEGCERHGARSNRTLQEVAYRVQGTEACVL
jgi:long-chain acyl-CoA synthetase